MLICRCNFLFSVIKAIYMHYNHVIWEIHRKKTHTSCLPYNLKWHSCKHFLYCVIFLAFLYSLCLLLVGLWLQAKSSGNLSFLQPTHPWREKTSHVVVFHWLATSRFALRIRSDQIRLVASDSLRPHESQHSRPPCPSPTPGVHPDSGP